MRKLIVNIVLTPVLMCAAISVSMAATDEAGGTVTAPPPDNTKENILPPEPGANDAKPGAAEDSTAEDNRKRLKARLEAKEAAAAKAKSGMGEEEVVPKSEFYGKYFGARFGLNSSSASGTTEAPSATTLAYGVQGGYLQGGYNWDLSIFVVGLGAYMDWNNYTIHSNDVAYSSRAYGLDAKLGVPIEGWFPYVKLGYGRSTGAGNEILGTVAQKSSNIAIGLEYNVASRWSLVAELKKDSFSNRDKSITINNRVFAFGFNYYFDKPIKDDKVEVVEEFIPIPEPIIAPDAVPEDAPPP